MTFLQRALRAWIRKPWKSLLLLLVLCTISLLFLCGMTSRTATVAANDSTRQAVGAGFLLETNPENRSQRLAAASAKIGEREGTADGVHQKKQMVNGQEMWQTWTDNSFETLEMDYITALVKTEGVADYNVTTVPTAVKPDNFLRIEDTSRDQSADEGGVALVGDRNAQLDSDVLSGTVTLTSGRWAEPDDTDVCVVSDALAEKNNLSLGDTLSFSNLNDDTKTVTATIIGIYKETGSFTPYMSGDTYRAENVIFCDLHLPERVTGEGPLYERAYFKVADVDQYETVRAAMMKADIDWQRYDFIDNNGNLQIMADNFNGLAALSNLLLAVVSASGFAVLALVLIFWTRTRRRELGVLLALGACKRELWLQLLVEVILTSVLAVALSFLIAPLCCDAAAHMLAQAQSQQQALNETAEAAYVATDYVAPVLTLETVDTTLSPALLALDAGSVGLLSILATSLAAVCILHRKPRDLINAMK